MTWTCDPAATAALVDTFQAAGPLFVHTVQSILAAHCALVGDDVWPTDATDRVLDDPNYDFIVVGSGSAGAVVANRLSEVPHWKILLVEAGGNPSLATEMPQPAFTTLGTPADWAYKVQPDKGSCRSSKGGRCAWPRGKVLGGCSSTNAMFYVRGNELDYDEWAAMGNKGWSFEDVLPYFMKSENFSQTLHNPENRKLHGENGYLNVEISPVETHDIEKLIIQMNTELGVKYTEDMNGINQMGVSVSYTTTKNGVRHSTARAFLNTVKDRKNIDIVKDAFVTKIEFEDNSNTVVGVRFLKNGKEVLVKAKKEIIISAGVINTPQLLMLSGVGPRAHLNDLGIEVKADLPVGENLQDHVFVPIYFKLNNLPGDKSFNSIGNITAAFMEFILSNSGRLASNSPHRIISFLNTTDPTASSPDIQLHHLLLPPSLHNLMDINERNHLSDNITKMLHALNENNFILALYVVLLKPKSRGKILLSSTNPNEHPLIYANYFNDPDDMKTLINGVKHALKMEDTETMRLLGGSLEWIPLPACQMLEKKTDNFIDCVARELTLTMYHPTGSTKMGSSSDRTSVVDAELKVHNVNGLRVMDASIMPSIPRGNTNAAAIMIGEKGADLIKATWLHQHTDL